MKKKILFSSLLFCATSVSSYALSSARTVPIQPPQYMLKCPVLNQLDIHSLCNKNEITKDSMTLKTGGSCKTLAFGKLTDRLVKGEKQYDGKYDHTDNTCNYTIHPLTALHKARNIKAMVTPRDGGSFMSNPQNHPEVMELSSQGMKMAQRYTAPTELPPQPPRNMVPPPRPGTSAPMSYDANSYGPPPPADVPPPNPLSIPDSQVGDNNFQEPALPDNKRPLLQKRGAVRNLDKRGTKEWSNDNFGNVSDAPASLNFKNQVPASPSTMPSVEPRRLSQQENVMPQTMGSIEAIPADTQNGFMAPPPPPPGGFNKPLPTMQQGIRMPVQALPNPLSDANGFSSQAQRLRKVDPNSKQPASNENLSLEDTLKASLAKMRPDIEGSQNTPQFQWASDDEWN